MSMKNENLSESMKRALEYVKANGPQMAGCNGQPGCSSSSMEALERRGILKREPWGEHGFNHYLVVEK